MKLLAIDTSGSALSAAIAQQHEQQAEIISSFGINTGRNHSLALLPMLRELLANCQLRLADMQAFAVTIGPGSFTGLRIGCATVKAWAHALQRPVIAVSSTEAAARSVASSALVCPIFNARRNEVYAALFQHNQRLWEDQALSPEDLAQRLLPLSGQILPVGDGWLAESTRLQELLPGRWLQPSINNGLFMAEAAAMIGLEEYAAGRCTDPVLLAPKYLRLSEAEEKLLARQAQPPRS
jgi:tRNA threonylcarbamoyladenosine biosynthesis protein TsaB